MQNQTVTPVQVVQELIAMLTTRKEAIDRIMSKPDAGSLVAGLRKEAQQTDHFISGLQTELSAFGDAVMADVDRDNTYHSLWREGLGLEGTASATELHGHFKKMDEALVKEYQQYTSSSIQLPPGLSELLHQQLAALGRG
jgi:hypothetical protein